MPNLSYENEFDLHENEPVGGTDFHMNGFTIRTEAPKEKYCYNQWTIIN